MKIVRVLLVIVALLAVVFYVVFGNMVFGNMPAVADAEIAPGVVQIVDGYVNAFFVEGGPGQVALIDAGNDPAGTAVLASLGRRGHQPSDVKAILLTHGHPDHTAAAHLFPGAAVYAFPADAPVAAGEKRAAGPLPKLLDTPKEKTVKVTHPLTDGEVVRVGTATITAFLVPGHTGGSAAYLYEGVLFVGDSANGRADGTVVSAPWVVSDDCDQNVASLAELRERFTREGRSVKVLAFGHSGPKTGGGLMAALAPPPTIPTAAP